MFRALLVVEVLLIMSGAAFAQTPPGAIVPSSWELSLAHRWTAAHLTGDPAPAPARLPGIIVFANNDPVQMNSRNGRPMRIAQTQYTRGLYCHAVSRVLVQLPGPGATFTSLIGCDNNENTSGGRGSIIFSVKVGGEEELRSQVFHGGDEAEPIEVNLAGATELNLDVDDAGDGISCDQADWADARVVLRDGQEIWLGDLPILEQRDDNFTTEAPFSFTFNGQPSADLLAAWPAERTSVALDASRVQHASVWTDPASGLQVRCVAVEYLDYPVVEWTVYLRNTGDADTPLVESLMGLDTRFARGPQTEFAVHHQVGSICAQNDFEPSTTTLDAGESLRLTSAGGRGSDGIWPYFNTEWGGRGLISVVGWPGQWESTWTRDEGSGLRFRAGQEQTRFVLHPGEEVRSPLIALLFWQGEWLRSQNLFRRWMLEHNVPRQDGEPAPPHYAACSSHQYGEMVNATSDTQTYFVDRYLDHGLKLDYWWMDAGWYPNAWGWPNTGTWEVDPKRFPGGFKPISDHAHSRDVDIIVWFEPERVTPGTDLYQHPDWLLGNDGDQKLLNLGNPEARQWLTDHVDALLTREGIDLYRQDFNIDPLRYWRANDAADRQGITENHHVSGYLAYWDELLRRHPGMLIDSCASGGRRNDLETMRRSVPLLRSDYIFEPVGQQAHTWGLALWLPVFGTGFNTPDAYGFRSAMVTFLNTCWDMRNDANDWEAMRARIAEWRQVAPLFRYDYYPLTPYTRAADQWMAWQFSSPEQGLAVVEAFRRDASPYESARFRLQGLDRAARYAVANLDEATEAGANAPTFTGAELMDQGLLIVLDQRPDSALFMLKRL